MAKAVKTIKKDIPEPKKETKKRANKYEEKLLINGSFENLISDLVKPINLKKK